MIQAYQGRQVDCIATRVDEDGFEGEACRARGGLGVAGYKLVRRERMEDITWSKVDSVCAYLSTTPSVLFVV